MEKILIIAIILILIFLSLLIYCSCKIASKADKEMEEQNGKKL